MKNMLSQIIRSSVLGTAALLALIFIPAGTLQYWQGWAYVVIAIVASGAYTLYLARHDPALLKRRTEAGISYERETAQKSSYFCSLLYAPRLSLYRRLISVSVGHPYRGTSQ